MRSPFKNRTEAALMLAEKLQWLKGEGQEDSLLVLAIPRGGVVKKKNKDIRIVKKNKM